MNLLKLLTVICEKTFLEVFSDIQNMDDDLYDDDEMIHLRPNVQILLLNMFSLHKKHSESEISFMYITVPKPLRTSSRGSNNNVKCYKKTFHF